MHARGAPQIAYSHGGASARVRVRVNGHCRSACARARRSSDSQKRTRAGGVQRSSATCVCTALTSA
eukprot:1295042-Pleurochrysis_carterae.AAC.1